MKTNQLLSCYKRRSVDSPLLSRPGARISTLLDALSPDFVYAVPTFGKDVCFPDVAGRLPGDGRIDSAGLTSLQWSHLEEHPVWSERES